MLILKVHRKVKINMNLDFVSDLSLMGTCVVAELTRLQVSYLKGPVGSTPSRNKVSGPLFASWICDLQITDFLGHN